MYWMLSEICEWLIVDSYALEQFPKSHPFLGYVVAMIYAADGFGARYLLIGALIVIWLYVRSTFKGEGNRGEGEE